MLFCNADKLLSGTVNTKKEKVKLNFYLTVTFSVKFFDRTKPTCTILALSNTDTAVAANSTLGVAVGLESFSVCLFLFVFVCLFVVVVHPLLLLFLVCFIYVSVYCAIIQSLNLLNSILSYKIKS